MYRLCLKIDSLSITGELLHSWALLKESSEACIIQVITALHAFSFLHSCHYRVWIWIHCWKTSLFLPVTEMLSQEIKRKEDYEKHFARSLLDARRNQWILERCSALLQAYMILLEQWLLQTLKYVKVFTLWVETLWNKEFLDKESNAAAATKPSGCPNPCLPRGICSAPAL